MRSTRYPSAKGAIYALVLAMVCGVQTVVGGVYTDKLDNADRVLLMNNFKSGESTITGQGYDSICKLNDEAVSALEYNLLPGTEFCFSNATERTWHLSEVRLGNVFDCVGFARGSTHNYLPWRRNGSMQATNSTAQVYNQQHTGHISMRNNAMSRVVSPKYADGIGRIYLDAVNFSTNTANSLTLSVCTDMKAADADENWETSESCWTPAEVAVYAITNGALASVSTATNVTLAMTAGGNTNNFYRLVLSDPRFVNWRKPARFKLARTDFVYPDDPEGEGMVLIDNIICSYPVPTVEITPPGTFDGRLLGEKVLGWPLALKEADDDILAHFGATNLVPHARLEYVTNQVDLGAVAVTNIDFHYRWRYLSQDILGSGASTSTNLSSSAGAVATESLSKAWLSLPQFDDKFQYVPVSVSAITLGNTSFDTAEKVQYLRLKVDDAVYVSKILNYQAENHTSNGTRDYDGNGVYDDGDKHPDKSWKLRFKFDPAVTVRTAREYQIEFLDKFGTVITKADKMRVVDPAVKPGLGYAVKADSGDVKKFSNAAYTYLQAEVECEYKGDFAKLAIDPATLQGAPLSAEYTANPGDVEFYYTADIDTPYYGFVDYAGAGVAWLDGDFEHPGKLEFRRQGGKVQSCGTDYFTRLRDGSSEIASFEVEYCSVNTTNDATVCKHSALIGNWNWAALLPTPTNGACRVRARTIDANNVTNYLDVGDWEYSAWPSTMSVKGFVGAADKWVNSTNSWKKIEYDGTTGYLRFRYIEDTGAIVVSRADYQDFDGWNDANKYNAEVFVGTGTHTNSIGSGVTGVSKDQISVTEHFDGWGATTATNVYWRQIYDLDPTKHKLYQNIDSTIRELNGFESSSGQYIYKKYNNAGNGYALQLFGKGQGLTQFAKDNATPRGIETVNYTARIAQTMDFSNFAYYSAGEDAIGAAVSLSNYTFSVRARMGNSDENGHDGQAQLSLVAYHTPGGCYEFRITQVGAGNNYIYELYRWNLKNRKMTPKLLGEFPIKTTSVFDSDNGANVSRAPAAFLSVRNIEVNGTNAVQIVGGVQQDGNYTLSEEVSGRKYGRIVYNDASPEQLKRGSFGVASLNCPGYFFIPTYYPNPVEDGYSKLNAVNGYGRYGIADAITFKGKPVPLHTSLRQSPDEYSWMYGNWMERFFPSDFVPGVTRYWGLRCEGVSQDLILSLRSESTTGFEPVMTNKVSSFALQAGSFPVYSREKCALQLSAGGTSDDFIQTDVVIGNFDFRPWSGADYNSTDLDQQTYFDNKSSGCDTNIVFTSAWIHEEVLEGETPGSSVTNKIVELNASRSPTNRVVSLRSPVFDGDTSDSGIGLGMVAFSYTNCNENVNLLVQIATNRADSLVRDGLVDKTAQFDGWITVTNFSGSAVAAEKKGIPLKVSGVASCYLGMHGVEGAIRVVMDPEVVAESYGKGDPAYGRIFIGDITFRDEPRINLGCWWGWNMRTGSFLHEQNDGLMQYLADGTEDSEKWGMSGALNSSVSEKILLDEADLYVQHLPFIQTPTFPANDASKGITNAPVVGELTFKARRYDTAGGGQARVTLYGAKEGDDADIKWVYLAKFNITNTLYQTYTYSRVSSDYKAYRLAVAGVKDTDGDEITMGGHTESDIVVRVAIDNVYVAETIVPKFKFENVMAFRDNLDTLTPFDYAKDAKREQPLVNENWGVQAEVWPVQLKEEIDYSKPIKVHLSWNDDERIWGYDNWASNATGRAELQQCAEDDGKLVFRSTTASPDSIIPPVMLGDSVDFRPQTVQYMLEVEFYTVDHSDNTETQYPQIQRLSDADWVRPSWYNGVDRNREHADDGGFAAYNILDSIAPGWAWINEANLFDGYSSSNAPSNANQYVEVAMPYPDMDEISLKQWELRLISLQFSTNTITFDGTSIPASKTANAASNMVFMVVGSPGMVNQHDFEPSEGKLDGSWGEWAYLDNTFGSGGTITSTEGPVAIQLVRRSGIIEHEVVVGGTNTWNELGMGSKYSPGTLATNLNLVADGTVELPVWFAAGEDWLSGDYSLSVTNGAGVAATNWVNSLKRTPGEINDGQYINPVHPVPEGELVIIRALIDEDSKAIMAQYNPRADTTTTDQLSFTVKKGSSGTNLVYRIKPFHELDRVLTDGTEISAYPFPRAGSNVVVTVGANVSNNFEVVASARIMAELAESPFELQESSAYRDAVVKWLGEGKTKRGAFANQYPNSTNEIHLARLWEYGNAAPSQRLTLQDMYCLDMDPTDSDQWYLCGGFTSGGTLNPASTNPAVVNTNVVQMTFFMCISNATDNTVYAPYMMRDRDGRDSQSDDLGLWNGPAFQVLASVQTNLAFNVEMQPLAWYVFDGSGATSKSFNPTAFTTDIAITDPHSTSSPGAYYDIDKFLLAPVFFKWKIDDVDKPVGVVRMTTDNKAAKDAP